MQPIKTQDFLISQIKTANYFMAHTNLYSGAQKQTTHINQPKIFPLNIMIYS